LALEPFWLAINILSAASPSTSIGFWTLSHDQRSLYYDYFHFLSRFVIYDQQLSVYSVGLALPFLSSAHQDWSTIQDTLRYDTSECHCRGV
jgi:hypothetical protein